MATESGSTTDETPVWANASSPIAVTESGTVTAERAVHDWKADIPIEVTESGIRTVTRSEHCWNALLGIDAMVSGRCTAARLTQRMHSIGGSTTTLGGMVSTVNDESRNARVPIDVTELGITIVTRARQPLKASGGSVVWPVKSTCPPFGETKH